LNDSSGGTTIAGGTAPGYAGTPVVVLRGPGAGSSAIGLQVLSAHNKVVGLEIDSFGEGIEITGPSATDNLILSNHIVTDGIGVAVRDARNNHIGTDSDGVNDAPEANVISGNTGAGILIAGSRASGNSALGNSIFANGGLGIDLGGDGVTPNDFRDGDAGVNWLQNFPMLTDVLAGSGSTTFVGTLDSAPNTTFRIEFFTSPAADASGFGEGQSFIGAATITTDTQGQASFNKHSP